jgi:hypothetical protein
VVVCFWSANVKFLSVQMRVTNQAAAFTGYVLSDKYDRIQAQLQSFVNVLVLDGTCKQVKQINTPHRWGTHATGDSVRYAWLEPRDMDDSMQMQTS